MTDARSAWIQRALEAYEAPLLRYALRLVGDAERARDVVQDAFIRLCQSDPVAAGDPPTAWLFAVTRNRALDVRRKEKRMQTVADVGVPSADGHSAVAPVSNRWTVQTVSNRSRPESESHAKSVAQRNGHAAQASPAEVVEQRDSAAAAMRLLAELPERQQEVVRLKFQAGLSYREIAEVMDLSATNVGFLIHTALRALRTKMNAGPGIANEAGRSIS